MHSEVKGSCSNAGISQAHYCDLMLGLIPELSLVYSQLLFAS